MVVRHLRAADLHGKVIDAHAHLGVSLQAYARLEYPYAQSLEGLDARQRSAGVDASVVFPFSADLYFDPAGLAEGVKRPAAAPLSEAPYQVENEMLMREVFAFNPERAHAFIPFVSVDPARAVAKQLACLVALEKRYPIYGIKIVGVGCQSPVTALLDEGKALVDFAVERDLPFLLHTTADASEGYSYAGDCFRVIEEYRDLRFCLAHCIGFHRAFLEKADAMENVWVDTAALKIQVQCAREDSVIAAHEDARFPGDYTDHTAIMNALAEAFPETIIWGTDAPAYTYICRRKQGEDAWVDFCLKGSYEDEKAALDSLPEDLRAKVCNINTIRFLFGR